MFVTKERPGAGSMNRQDRTIENIASRMNGHGCLRLFAAHSRSRGGAARMELKRSLRASEEALQRLIEASLQGVLKVSGLGAIATDITERKRAESRRTIGLCQDEGKHAR
jgi:PAS domain-containing protein